MTNIPERSWLRSPSLSDSAEHDPV